jgi:hypothetical protein
MTSFLGLLVCTGCLTQGLFTGKVASYIAVPSSLLEVEVLLCELLRNFKLRTYYGELYCGVISSRLGTLYSSMPQFRGKNYMYLRLHSPGSLLQVPLQREHVSFCSYLL